MDEPSFRKDCSHGEITYTHGAELCMLDKCLICKDGEWLEKKIYGPYAPVP